MTFLKKFYKDDSGATAIEYGLIVALIAVAAITALQSTGTEFSGTLNKASTAMAAA
ncbi:Flp family type IVb pilin [Erythrobacter mangrovi]|uniref:Flp family type IVb pilin n=1 Tax=Erythrobacter mangrovi TaxID=2739433 RepID=A0A7D4B9G9_9SPHN|nr:Flp family type IVb pilin [Erythrobacter mangrovi]QKG72763.1 Flp family type IVb pilin [Erythrobacter mangrovi]